MQISKLTGVILKNKTVLNSLEKISEHGTSFAAGTSLLFACGVRPLSIAITPDTEKENKQYAIANSISSGLVKFGMVEAIALPVENAVKRIDDNPSGYLKPKTVRNLSNRAYKLLTQAVKLSTGFFTAIPKSLFTIALIPIIMDKLFFNKGKKQEESIGKSQFNESISFESFRNSINFTGHAPTNIFSKGIAKIIDNDNIQKIAQRYQTKDKDIAKHITAATDVLLTSTFAYQTNKSENIKKNRKKALIYNNVISTLVTLAGGYSIDSMIKNKSASFIEKFKQINIADPKVEKYIEGINIIRPAIIFAGIYYGILPIFSTYMSEKIDKFILKTQK